MDANPYEPPSNVDEDLPNRYRILFALMFWLSAILAFLVFASAVLVVYQNYVAVTRTGGSLPVYIPLLVVLIFCCSLGLAFSSTRWRKRRTRQAAISFVVSIGLLLVGPYILLMLLYGLPG